MSKRSKISVKRVFLLILSAISLIYTLMMLDTNSLVKRIEDIAENKVAMEDVEEPLALFNMYDGGSAYKIDRITGDIDRILVFHNWFDGHVLMSYRFVAYDANGKEISSYSDMCIMNIHKENGEWRVLNKKTFDVKCRRITFPW